MRDLTGGAAVVRVPGRTVGQALANLETICPGVWERLCDGKDLSPDISVAVDGEMSPMGMYAPLTDSSEVHFLPALEGG